MASLEAESVLYSTERLHSDVDNSWRSIESITPIANVDNILTEAVGACGLWQLGITVMLMISCSSLITFPVYANSASRFRCQLTPHVEKWIEQREIPFKVVSERIQPSFHSRALSGCTQVKQNWTEVDLEEFFTGNVDLNSTHLQESCTMGYVFENDPYYYPGNVIKEFETICDREWLSFFVTKLFMFGAALGMLTSGWSGNRFGRKCTIIGFTTIEIVSGFTVIFAPNYSTYATARLVTGLGTFGRICVSGILTMELTTARYRSMLKAMLVLGIACIYRGLMAIVAFNVPYWRWLHLFALSPNLFAVLYIPFLPESPRWLLSRERYLDAAQVLLRGFRVNHAFHQVRPEVKRRMDKFIKQLNKNAQEKQDSYSQQSDIPWWKRFKNTFATREIVRTSVLSIIVMLGINFVFFGILFYASMIRYYVYIVGLFNAAIALPGCLLLYLVYRFSKQRKRPLLILVSVAVVILLSCGLYTTLVSSQYDSEYFLIVCTNTTLCILLAVGNMTQVYIPELFPTAKRTLALGFVMGVSTNGAILSTMVNRLDHSIAHGLPLIIYAITLLFVCIALGFLKETTGEDLPDN